MLVRASWGFDSTMALETLSGLRESGYVWYYPDRCSHDAELIQGRCTGTTNASLSFIEIAHFCGHRNWFC